MKYEPENQKVIQIWNRLSPEARETRFTQAQKKLELIKALDERGSTESERAASIRLNAGVDRTTIRRWREKFNKLGFDGLINLQIGPDKGMPEDIQTAICTLRRMTPNISVEVIMSYVKEHHDYKISSDLLTWA
ncbi:HTH-type transcription regulator domain-containing protein [Desulfonema limicola]|uniref:HTH-type transcription regulator domain-containing protein n=1 Tax=Desulfonema limicola TaxID=45656 RepID=A0A975B4P2_9BACT|nr:helix-turn-helix domain containing protein [Desulfonema limicola]QTA78726.1 HTH-type transcription regulator domain-containing protein [Desulfonema limicola]